MKPSFSTQIRFLGAAGTVTGSKHLFTVTSFDGEEKNILVDCGLFQGVKDQRLENWAPFPIDAEKIDLVILTHAHLDHTGYLPLLVKQGFTGKIYCSDPTAELTRLVLLDAAHVNEEEAERANREKYSKHSPALPLYRTSDVEAIFSHFRPTKIDQWLDLFDDSKIRLRLSLSGHILGSTFVEILVEDKIIAFSGDLGRANPLTLNPPSHLQEADVLVIESTYGDRLHSKESPLLFLEKEISETVSKGGTVLLPAFAIGRTQDTLHLLALLHESQKLPPVKIYLDSPMGDRVNHVFDHYPKWHRLSSPDLKRIESCCSRIDSMNQSMAVAYSKEPCIIIAGSGMLSGGRILNHLASRITKENTKVILTGFQAAGTLGRFLKEGATEVKMFGKFLPVHCQISEITSLSAHADRGEIIEWMRGFQKLPKKIMITHGEPQAAEGLRLKIQDVFGVQAHVARHGETVKLF